MINDELYLDTRTQKEKEREDWYRIFLGIELPIVKRCSADLKTRPLTFPQVTENKPTDK